MSRLDRWRRTTGPGCSDPSQPTFFAQLIEIKIKNGHVADVAGVAGWEKWKRYSSPAIDPLQDRCLATIATPATEPNRVYEINELGVSPRLLRGCYTVILDFETRNTGGCKLEIAGAWRYAADPATEILTLVYQGDGGDSLLWTPEQGNSPPLADLATDPDVHFVCFAGFEPAIWARIMVERYGFAPIPIERWIDMQAVCSYLALPRSLGKALPVIGAPVVKDLAGARLVRSLSRPHRKTGLYPEVTPEVLERVHSYNKIDVTGLVELHRMLGELPERERKVWEFDQKINQRGLGIDVEFVRAAKQIARRSSGALLAEFAERTGGLTPYQVSKTLEWLKGQGFALPNLQEETVAEALEQVLPDHVRRVLVIRAVTASTSVKKLDAMLACVGPDGRARGLLQYHAATPGRWSGSLLQPQNLPRPTFEIVDPDALVTAVKTGRAKSLRRWGRPIEVLASALRYAIVARDGAQFGIGDFSMIEACILLALAGQHDKTALIAEGTDVYRDMAARIFGLDRDSYLAIAEEELSVEQTEQRRIGKGGVLGCGYQVGAETFRRQFLRHLAAEEGKALAERAVHAYRKEWAPKVPMLWRDLEQTARRAMSSPGVTAVARCGIGYRLEQKAGLPVLVCRLLNGKLIHYQNARVSERPGRYGEVVWSYWAYRRGQWREIEPYGGQLTENVCQALARELLVDAMFRFEARDFSANVDGSSRAHDARPAGATAGAVVLTVHDEIVVEHPDITEDLVKEIMTERPSWAERLGVPVMVKAHTGRRYGK